MVPDGCFSSCIGMVAASRNLAIAQHGSALPQSRRRKTSLQNRTVPFNIASIFSLSMLFSKNSGNSFPDPFEKNTSNDACATVQIPWDALNDHSRKRDFLGRIKRVIFNIAHFCALSNINPKIFRFFFGSPAAGVKPRIPGFLCRFEENTGLLSDRYHIKYTQIPPLSSRFP